MSLPRLYRTIRHLTVRQAVGQLRLRLGRLRGDVLGTWAAAPAQADRPALRPGWSPVTDWLAPPQRTLDPADIRAGTLTMIGRTFDVGYPPRWDDPAVPRLWSYNLHYMDYLWALPFADAKTVVADYLQKHTPKRGHAGWEPYPLSLRLMNGCAYFLGEHREETLADDAFAGSLTRTLSLMADWLSRRLETHIGANHLLENYVALAFVGACFRGEPVAEAWTRTGLSGLGRELGEQVLADGGHYERSPMYQCRLLAGLLWLINTGDAALAALCRPTAEQMASHLAQTTHPDGGIALFNDAAMGIYNTPGELLDYAEQLGLDVRRPDQTASAHLAETGYAIGRGDDGGYVMLDIGEVGPPYQPGHAHSDLLSFELSLLGKRLIVDAGNHDYEPGSDLRRYCRSVRGHNTVEINGQDQIELWSTFRVGRRAKPVDVFVDAHDGGGLGVTASHDGYAHLPGSPYHIRRLRWHGAGVLLVQDSAGAKRPIDAVGRLHIDPSWDIAPRGDGRYLLSHGEDRATLTVVGDAIQTTIEDGHNCPGFYDARPCKVVTTRGRGKHLAWGTVVARGASWPEIEPFEGATLDQTRYAW